MKKIKVAVLFGGKSKEHEVSLRSAFSVIREFDINCHQLTPVFIDKHNQWWLYELEPILMQQHGLAIDLQANAKPIQPTDIFHGEHTVDVIFPVTHGGCFENGAIQGLFELYDMPYVGANVLTSALGMDKAFSKIIVRNTGMRVADFILFSQQEWQDQRHIINDKLSQLTLPLFVKPNNTGSSIGISKVASSDQLIAAVEKAFTYHHWVIVESGIVGREIEVSVLQNIDDYADPLTSVAGEIITQSGFYDYNNKYSSTSETQLLIPADLDNQQMATVRKAAATVFTALQGEGMARIDLFIENNSQDIIFNEINTLPGFTSISMYPQLWQKTGMVYSELLSRLVTLALQRQQLLTA